MEASILPGQIRPIEILMVEDNPGDIELTRVTFRQARINNQLHTVKDGEAALDFLFKNPPYQNKPSPDIILLDIHLPKINGIQVLETIKENPETRSIPVLMLTSSETGLDIKASYKYHADSYITKPIQTEDFLSAVSQLENIWLTLVKQSPDPD